LGNIGGTGLSKQCLLSRSAFPHHSPPDGGEFLFDLSGFFIIANIEPVSEHGQVLKQTSEKAV
jgi:hypothetical protein